MRFPRSYANDAGARLFATVAYHHEPHVRAGPPPGPDPAGHGVLAPRSAEADALRSGTAPPTYASAAADPDGTAAWIRGWREFESATGEPGEHIPGARVTWTDRRQTGFGTTAIPQRVEVLEADAIARLAGQTAPWEQLLDRTRRMLDLGPDPLALRRAAAATSTTSQSWDDDAIARLLAVCRWALANPTAGLRARETAMPGVDTKWIEKRTRVVETHLDAASASSDASAGAAVSGLGPRGPDIRVRMRVLDPDLAFGLRDVESPVDQLATLCPGSEGPRRVVVVAGLWSRRIDSEHRLVCLTDHDELGVLSTRFHYE